MKHDEALRAVKESVAASAIELPQLDDIVYELEPPKDNPDSNLCSSRKSLNGWIFTLEKYEGGYDISVSHELKSEAQMPHASLKVRLVQGLDGVWRWQAERHLVTPGQAEVKQWDLGEYHD